MESPSSHPERATSETRWLSPGLSVFVLMALLSTAPGAFAVECSPAQARVMAGTAVMPLMIVACAAEEPVLWHCDLAATEFRVAGAQVRAVIAPVREALLCLPPPTTV